MKSIFNWLMGTTMFLSAFTACTDESETLISEGLKEIIVNANHFIPETDSRAFYLDGNSVEFKWVDGDTIGIFPNEGAQAYFPILTTDEASSSASFTGGGWALKPSSAYAAYYPFIGKFYINKNEVPISYVGQKQKGNSSMEHLNAYDFMVASASTPQSGRANFQMAHLGSFVQLKITMPQGGTLSSVTLSADEALFVTKGTMDVMAATPAVKAVETSNTLTLDVEDVTTTAESPVATLYMMLAPVDFTDKTLNAIVKTNNGRSETITLTSKNFEAGKAYAVSGAMEDSEAAGIDGGTVTITTAGTLKSLLGSDYLKIGSLKVVGPINGDDIYYLRKMLGGSNFSEADWGKLTTLDLSEATIVEGGGWYYDHKETYISDEYTSNNTIGRYMFYECTNLKDIELPKNITSIGSSAFSGCDALATVYIPNCVASIASSAFSSCDALTKATILSSGEVGKYAFSGCSTLSNVVIGDYVTSIGYGAFSDCDALTDITIGDGVKSIDERAFFSVENLNVYIKSLESWCNIDFNTTETDNSGTGHKLYYSNPLHDGGSLYLNNELLAELQIPESIINIKPGAFEGCKSFTNLKLSDNTTLIGESAFSNCDGLVAITLGNGVNTIESFAFYDCDALVTVVIPDNVTSLEGDFTYRGCDALTSVTIGNGITELGAWTFKDCGMLNKVVLGKNITETGSDSFSGCSLSEVYCYATTPPNISGATTKKEEAILYVPARCGATYKASTNWGYYFTNIIEMD